MKKVAIYLENHQAVPHRFWCFLAKPTIQSISSDVYARSSVYITIPPSQETPGATNYILVSSTFVVGVGATNTPVAPGVLLPSKRNMDADLGMAFGAGFAPKSQCFSNELPELESVNPGGQLPEYAIGIGTNVYDKSQESIESCYGSLFFGTQTQQGAMGTVWSSDPQRLYVVVPSPDPAFYISVMDYVSNTAVDYETISTNAAHLSITDFAEGDACTVILQADGSWAVRSGRPK